MGRPTTQDEQGFKQMWKQAQVDFESRTQRSLAQSSQRSLDEVLKELQERLSDNSDDDSSSRKKQKVKAVLSNVLTLVNLLGGLAAQGASIVFGPATMCFNAVQFLIDIHARIGRFYEDLGKLFDEINIFLMQFQIYQRIEEYGEVDVELKRTTHRLMILFVETVAISIEFMSASRLRKFGHMTKITLFDDDSGVSSKLAEFHKLIDHQSRISDAVTLEHVLKAEKNSLDSVHSIYQKLTEDSEANRREFISRLDGMHDDVRTLVAERKEKAVDRRSKTQVDKIADKLGIKLETVTSHKHWFTKTRQQSVEQTGSWLSDIPVYSSWLSNRETESMLLICGEEGSGKTHLLSAVAYSLQFGNVDSADSSDEVRLPLAVYSFSGRGDSKQGSGNDSIEREIAQSITALKSMAVQLSQQDAKYEKDIWTRLERRDPSFIRDMDLNDLSQELFPYDTNTPPKHMLLIDGFDKLGIEEAKQTFKSLRATRGVRTIISGNGESMRSCLETIGLDLGWSLVIRNESHNDDDIKHFIDSELKRRTNFHGDGGDITKIISRIKEKLPSIAQGNFGKAQWILDRVESSIEANERIDEFAERYLSDNTVVDQSPFGQQIIKDLQESLSSQQIPQLNCIFTWAVFGFQWLRVEEIRAILFSDTKRETIQLEKKVREKYSKALYIDNQGFVKARFHLNDYLQGLDRQAAVRAQGAIGGPITSSNLSEDEPTISMNLTLKNVRLSQARRFFWNLSERALFEEKPFRFDDSLPEIELKQDLGETYIDGHLRIFRTCLELLFREANESTQILVSYALRRLPDHLWSLTPAMKDGRLSYSEVLELTHKLVDLLRDTEWVERHWGKADDVYAWWFTSEDSAAVIFWEWITNVDIKDTLKPKEQRWLSDVTRDSNHKENILMDITVAIARKWLCERTWHDCAGENFAWIDRFIDLERRPAPPDTMKDVETSEEDDTSSDNAARFRSEEAQTDESMPHEDTDSQNPKDTASMQNHAEQLGQEKRATASTQPEQEDQSPENATEATNESSKGDGFLSSLQRIRRAVEWTESKLPNTGDRPQDTSLWQERLGWLFLHHDCFNAAVEPFQNAKSFPDCHWLAFQGLAQAYSNQGKKREAVEEVQASIEMLRNIPSRSEFEQRQLLLQLMSIAVWQRELKLPDVAITNLQKALVLDPHSYLAYDLLLMVLMEEKRTSELLDVLEKMVTERGKDQALTKLQEMLLEFTGDEEPLAEYPSLLLMTRNSTAFEKLLQSFQDTLDYARDNNMKSKILTLLLAKGDAIGFPNQRQAYTNEQAISEWRACCDEGFSANLEAGATILIAATERIIKYHHSSALADQKLSKPLDVHVAQLQQLESRMRNNGMELEDKILQPLAKFYSQFSSMEKARKLVIEDMKSALDILSDDDPLNDDFGYRRIFDALSHTGDNLGALSATSLWFRHFRTHIPDLDTIDLVKQGDEPVADNSDLKTRATANCDGPCGKKWTGSWELYMCCSCFNLGFCVDCMPKLHDNTFDGTACSADHEHLYIPSWPNEEYEGLKDTEVRIEGALVDGKRVGGRIVPVTEWLDMLRKEWGLEKPSEEIRENNGA